MIELKRNSGDQFFIWIVAGLFGIVLAMFTVVGVSLIAGGNTTGWMLIAFALPFAWLGGYVYREAAARSFTRIAVDAAGVQLRLPARRSYVPLEKIETSVPLSAIRAIEARTEAFRALGTTVLQRAFSLLLTDNSRIVLGADRRFTQPYFQTAASAISAQAQIPVRDLGLVDANAGFMMIAGHSAPPWDAAAVAPDTMQKRYSDESRGMRIAMIVAAAAAAVGALSRAFGG